jgi:hypothetical protein
VILKQDSDFPGFFSFSYQLGCRAQDGINGAEHETLAQKTAACKSNGALTEKEAAQSETASSTYI